MLKRRTEPRTFINTNIVRFIWEGVLNSSADLTTLVIEDIFFLNQPYKSVPKVAIIVLSVLYTLFFSFDDDSLRSSQHIRRLATPHIDITCTITHNNVIFYTSHYKSYNTQIHITYLLVGGRMEYTFRRNSVSSIYDIRI